MRNEEREWLENEAAHLLDADRALRSILLKAGQLARRTSNLEHLRDIIDGLCSDTLIVQAVIEQVQEDIRKRRNSKAPEGAD